jgi:phosphoribosylaminoimidazole carboxylase (NCAIR synthetase)
MKIGVLGGGQLGRMLALAGYPLGLRFCFLDPSPRRPPGISPSWSSLTMMIPRPSNASLRRWIL